MHHDSNYFFLFMTLKAKTVKIKRYPKKQNMYTVVFKICYQKPNLNKAYSLD